MTQPIGDSAFAQLMSALGPFEPAPHLAVAVSGGSDSLALLLLLARWVTGQGGRLTALSIDHGLRPEAAAECRQVGAIIAGINAGCGGASAAMSLPIAHEILTWSGDKPRHGIMAAARSARYRLLLDWCRAHDVLHLALGHHADDQAETVLMRRAHGSGRRGLAGMTAIRAMGGVRVLRPLLASRKPELMAMVTAAGLSWIEDPSNATPRYERVRWRQHLGLNADIADLLLDAAAAGRQRDNLERQAAGLLARSARIDPAGYLTIDRRQLLAADDDLGQTVLRQGLALVGNGDYPPGPGRIAHVLSLLRQQSVLRLTLGGCLIIGRGDTLSLFREAAACEAPKALVAGQNSIWDGRFAGTLAEEGHQELPPSQGTASHGTSCYRIAAIGEYGLANRRLPAALAALPAPARNAQPGLWQGERLVGLGHLCRREQLKAGAEPELEAGIYKLDVYFQPSQAATSCGFTVVLPARHTM
jgi:tRNA(Ile)-lysidine synthase